MRTIVQGTSAIVAILLAGPALGQSQLQFTKTLVTSEGAIQLYWQSDPNSLYQVQYLPDLSGNYAWQVLLDNYPAQGTNTLWLDTGDYLQAPSVNHPKYDPTRFYRIACIGTNPVQPPNVTVTSPTNGALLSGLVTVSVATASASLPYITPTLYVDGQAMDTSSDGTNFVINTCEWPNGPHVLFATAKGQDNIATSGAYAVNTAYGVSPYVPVTFNNLISQVGFSEQFFDPTLGQTQQVTAAFAAYVNWTLQMIDENSNAVRTVTGAGTTLAFNWDGTGDGGTNLGG